jgi:putative transcription factor
LRELSLASLPPVGTSDEQEDEPNQEIFDRLASDGSDNIVKPTTLMGKIGLAISDRRQKMEPKMTQKDLARKCGISATIVDQFERGIAAPDQKYLAALENALDIRLRGSDIGALKNPEKK